MASLFSCASDIALDLASPIVISPAWPGDTTAIDDAGQIPPNKLVFLVGPEDDPQTLAWNDRLCMEERPFLVLTPGATFSLIGPLVLPQSSACLRCLATQIALGALAPDSRTGMEPDLSRLAWLRQHLQTVLEQTPISSFIGRRYRLDANGALTEDTLIARFYDCEGCRKRSRFPAEIYYATQLFPKN